MTDRSQDLSTVAASLFRDNRDAHRNAVDRLGEEHLAAVTGSKTVRERKIGGEWYVPADCDLVVYLGSDAKRGK